MTTRRGFIAAFAAAAVAPRLGWAAVGNPAYLAAALDPNGAFALYGIDPAGETTFRVGLPARGHAGAAHPGRAEAVVFARRPGQFALVLDCATGAVLHRLSPPDGHHFNGHGCFGVDGDVLFTSEQLAESSEGRIGIWDVRDGYRRVGELRSGGIGPHEIRLMPDGRALVVANGGIATDPQDRRKLNIATMRPNLTCLSLSGELLDQVELPAWLWKNSIRHLAVRPDGLVGFAMQWEGDPAEMPPLLGMYRPGSAPRLLEAPLAEALAMQGYAGSVAFSGDGRELAISSPKGGRVHRFSNEGDFLGAVRRTDVCGLAPREDGFLASDGLGGLIAIARGRPERLARQNCAWDNHVVAV